MHMRKKHHMTMHMPMRRAPMPGRRPDMVLAGYAAAVMNPWAYGNVRGIAQSGLTNSATTKRVRTFQFSVNGPGQDTAEIAISLMDPRDPFLMVWQGAATQSGYTWTASQSGYAPLVGGLPTPSTTTVPVGSLARVVSAGVCISYMGAEQTRGGSWYQFAHNKVTANGVFGSSTDSMLVPGSLRANLEERIGTAKVTDRLIRMLKAPSALATPMIIDPFNHEGTYPGPADVIQAGSDCIRLMYIGPSAPMTFEISVIEHLEYYHDTRKHDSVQAFNHSHGNTTTDILISHLTAPASMQPMGGAAGGPTIWEKIESATGSVVSAIGNAVNGAVGLHKAWQYFKGPAAAVAEDALIML